MITKSDMMDSMLEVCPSFRPVWDDFLADWSRGEERPLYVGLAILSRHLVDLLAAGRGPELARVFVVVERWHVDGDAQVREAATIGLLENLQNENLHTSTAPSQFAPFLLPESLKWWGKVEAFWANGTPITA